jgi:hypothetical protein
MSGVGADGIEQPASVNANTAAKPAAASRE